MSCTSPVRARLCAPVLAAVGIVSLATALSGAPSGKDSPQNTVRPPSAEVTAAATARKVVQRSPLPYSIVRKPSSVLRVGSSRTVRSGVNGQQEQTFRVFVQTDGTELKRELTSTRVLKAAQPEIVEEGYTAQLPSRGYFSGRRIITMNATWYDPYHDGSNDHGRTFTGVLAGYGVVAVDPHFMPLGTRLYIEGYGYAVAADTGGAIKGSRIDLAIDSQHDVKNVRDMKHVRVHILD